MERTEQCYSRLINAPEALQDESAQDVLLNSLDVLQDMGIFPSLYLKWASLLAMAEEQVQHWKSLHQRMECEADIEIRQLAEKEKRKVTEATVASLVALAKGVTESLENYEAHLAFRGKLKAIVDSLAYKKDMLQSVNSRQCKEIVPATAKY